jgi:hypothetical protein
MARLSSVLLAVVAALVLLLTIHGEEAHLRGRSLSERCTAPSTCVLSFGSTPCPTGYIKKWDSTGCPFAGFSKFRCCFPAGYVDPVKGKADAGLKGL